MYPLRLIVMLEQADPSFRDLLFPKPLRCSLDKRIVRAIEEHWPAYFPTRKECRGPRWSLTIPANEPLYKPSLKSKRKLAQWKSDIADTIAEIRSHKADLSWKRFIAICETIPRLRLLLRDLKPLGDFLINEESLWPSYRGLAVSQEDYFTEQMRALLSAGSPYRFSDPNRLRFLQSGKATFKRIRLIGLIQQLFDRPLMILAILQRCAGNAGHWLFWLPIQNHISAILETPSAITFRRTWLEHAMQVSGAIKRNGKSCPRKWAAMLVSEKDRDLNLINAKAVEVNSWLKGKKQPSMATVQRAGKIIFKSSKLNPEQIEAGKDLWLFSWMITLWLEKHFTEIAAEFKDSDSKIKKYYRRFFKFLKNDQWLAAVKKAGGPSPARL